MDDKPRESESFCNKNREPAHWCAMNGSAEHAIELALTAMAAGDHDFALTVCRHPPFAHPLFNFECSGVSVGRIRLMLTEIPEQAGVRGYPGAASERDGMKCPRPLRFFLSSSATRLPSLREWAGTQVPEDCRGTADRGMLGSEGFRGGRDLL